MYVLIVVHFVESLGYSTNSNDLCDTAQVMQFFQHAIKTTRTLSVYRNTLFREQVELLSGPNRCSLEACAPLLAAGGPSFIEALLCLYRGRGLHEDALSLATEERRVRPCSAGVVIPR